jgi:hypothetical protein
LDPDLDSDADQNQDLIKMLHPDPDLEWSQSGSKTLSDQIGSRFETMLSTNNRDPALCAIARDHGPALFDTEFENILGYSSVA